MYWYIPMMVLVMTPATVIPFPDFLHHQAHICLAHTAGVSQFLFNIDIVDSGPSYCLKIGIIDSGFNRIISLMTRKLSSDCRFCVRDDSI